MRTEEIFSKRLKSSMGKMTQRQLVAKIGTTEVTVSRWLNGSRIPKLTDAVRIASVLNVSLDYLSEIIIQSAYPISCSDWSEEQENHCVDLSYRELKEQYKTPHAWILTDVESIEDVWHYDHPNGAVIWVKDISPVDEMQDERLRYGY